MPLIKDFYLPSARTAMFIGAARYRDLAVLDFSTSGHSVYNYGQLSRIFPVFDSENAFTTHITETDIALGTTDRLFNAVSEIAASKKFRAVFLMPSSLSSVLGTDIGFLCERLTEKFKIKVFTSPAKLNSDFYEGGGNLLYSLVSEFVSAAGNKEKRGYNLINANFTDWSVPDGHSYLKNMLDKELELTCNTDISAASTLDCLGTLAGAQINIVTSYNAVKTADLLKQKFGTPYLYFSAVGEECENAELQKIGEICRIKRRQVLDAEYDYIKQQMINILNHTNPQILCYTDRDKLYALKNFFDGLGYFNVKYLCSHKSESFDYTDAGDFAKADFGGKLLLSYDRVAKIYPGTVTIDFSGLDFHLNIPDKLSLTGKKGAYRIMSLLSDKLLN